MSNHCDQKFKNQPIPKQEEPTAAGRDDRSDRGADLQTVLSKQLGPEYLSSRAGAGGSKLTYIEGWRVIALANEVFGYDGWSSETKSIEVDFVDAVGDGKYNVGVSAIVKISLRNGSSHEDVGYGKMENSRSKADALDKSKKEAVTDALKRTLRTFGNLLGNCLYDKNYLSNIKTMQAQKEKFLPSKLYRPEHVTTSSSSKASSSSTLSEPRHPSMKTHHHHPPGEEKPPLNPSTSRPAPLLNTKPPGPCSTSLKPSPPISAKPTPAYVPSKPAAHVPPTKPAPQLASKPVPYRPPLPPPVPVQRAQGVDKRKFQEEEEEEEEENMQAEGGGPEEGDEPAAPPATLSDKYFELDEQDLAELENVDPIDSMLCASQQPPAPPPGGGGGGGGVEDSADESGLITDTSVCVAGDTAPIHILPSRTSYNNRPPSNKPSHQPTKPASVVPRHCPPIRTPIIQSSIRYPSVPLASLRKQPLLPPHHQLHRPVKKLRAGES
ncbi:hypothetical protein PCANC_20896 [Puccinia coronata f. sp. avenae]|uniref:DNA repair and recombination protein RAD52 n=1 Tax=Puccinia coronata f. sp. avenae TaxID=200324 RepID=A0A2N5SM88_9BASI|nr:hypothetical protein PCANC_20896 [Puccinia coronata f. sp. avenae]